MSKLKIYAKAIIIILILLGISIPVYATKYKYDNLSRLVEVEYDSGQKITYTYDAGGNMLGVANSPALIDNISVDTNAYSLKAGETHKTLAIATLQNGNKLTITDAAKYTSSNTSVATVSWNGTVTALAPGLSTITITYGDKSVNVNVTVQPDVDLEAPVGPYKLNVGELTSNTVTLNWSPSTDNVAITWYYIYRGGTKVATTTSTTYTDDALTEGTVYVYSVKAFDAAGNISQASNIVSAAPGTSTITANVTLTEDRTYQKVYLKGGILNANAKTIVIKENMIHSAGTVYVNAGVLKIYGDYKMQTESGTTYTYGSGILKMVNSSDYVFVGGNFTTQSGADQTNMMNAGTLEVKGNFNQLKGTYSVSVSTYYRQDNFKPVTAHRLLLSGDQAQTVSFQDPGYSFINILEITNTSPSGVTFTTEARVRTELKNTTSVLVNAKNIILFSSAVISGGTWQNDIGASGWTASQDTSINGTLFANGLNLNGKTLTVNDMIFSGSSPTIDLNGGTLNVNGKVVQPTGTLFVDGGRMNVAGDYCIQSQNGSTYGNSSGILKMVNSSDYVFVGGNFATQSGADQGNMMTAGTLEIKGNFNQLKGTYSVSVSSYYRQDNFKPGGTHNVLLSGNGVQTVYYESYTSSRFNILTLSKPLDTGYAFNYQPVWVRRWFKINVNGEWEPGK